MNPPNDRLTRFLVVLRRALLEICAWIEQELALKPTALDKLQREGYTLLDTEEKHIPSG